MPMTDLFRLAGDIALRMPRLPTFILWNFVDKSDFCALVYHVEADSNPGCHDGGATLSWRSIWHAELEPSVVEVWEQVALQNIHSRRRSLQVNKILVSGVHGGEGWTHRQAAHNLGLPSWVYKAHTKVLPSDLRCAPPVVSRVHHPFPSLGLWEEYAWRRLGVTGIGI
ncbi:hypothetical protein B0T21DRAFT_136664 [Apiosordaria backusii]|uniref:DUF6546 domain-containing protein n=1 Tax=Apiosordaria backusii TaxID=314023 RepID=A0AA40EIN7_9PEZI|nr:hypothetical protein B0T21DRAFT_136664 [Apiosordaria backusii]